MARHAELAAALEGLPGVALRLDEPVARHSALRIGGEVEAWIAAFDEDGLLAAMNALRAAGLKLRPHQPLGDHYAREEGLSGAMLHLGPAFASVTREADRLLVGAAAPLARIGALARREGLEAWAPLARWPGTLGAWLHGADPARTAPLLESYRSLKGRSVGERKPATLSSLGSSILLGATLVARPDAPLPPPPLPPGGLASVDDDLRRALRHSRLPGLRLRGIRLADEEPGLVVNLGAGTSRDLDLVMRLVKERLLRDHGIELEPRLQPLGRPPKDPPHQPGLPPFSFS